MRTLFVTEFISLDGVVEAPGGEAGYRHSGWTFDIESDPTMYDFKLQETRDTADLVLGRTTYEGFAAAWPERDGEFADRLNGMPKHVLSTTLTEPTWAHTTVLGGVEGVADLRAGEGGPIQVAGSVSVARALAAAGLVDRYHLMVFPVVLGSGQRLFPSDAPDKQKLTLVESRTYANGVQLQVFDVVH